MPLASLTTFFARSGLAVAMCTAGLTISSIGIWAARRGIAEARGMEKLLALSNVCFAAPLAVFGALHLFGPAFVRDLVPAYMPWRAFWVYAVGGALIAASVSIATRIAVHWSGLLVGIMMFLFVAMLYLPSGLRHLDARITWVIVFRETSFGGAGWLLAGTAAHGWGATGKRRLIAVGRVGVTLALIVFGIQHFLHPTGLPGVPLQKQMAPWMPGRTLIDYLTGAGQLAAAASVLLNRHARAVTTWLGGWILLMVLAIYGPVLVAALGEPGIADKVVGINYFADTLLFAGAVLALARATPASPPESAAQTP